MAGYNTNAGETVTRKEPIQKSSAQEKGKKCT
jgi:hypothetical protein